MATEIQVLKQTELLGQQFVVYGTPNDPLFLAKDVAAWIEHTDVSKMVQCVDDDEKLTRTMFVSGQNREVWLLTENGLYEILMQSRKPIAKDFKRGVKKILHEIRTTGQYAVKPITQGQMLVQMAQAYEAQERMLMEQQAKQQIMEKQIHRLECATDVNYGFMAVLGYAKLHGIAVTRKLAATIGKSVSRYCRDNNIKFGSQKHPIFGNVNIYPDHALQAVFPKFFPNRSF